MDETVETPKIGIIHPISARYFDRLLNGRRVFFRFGARTYPAMKKGNRVVFYESGGARQLIGEGMIESIAQLSVGEATVRYGGNLFLDPEEIRKYANRWGRTRQSDIVVALVLRNIRRYRNPLKLERPIPPSGKSLTREFYQLIIKPQDSGIVET
jgi:hypothetical protein